MEIKHLHMVLENIPINKQYQSIRSNLSQHLIQQLHEGHCMMSDLCLHCGNNFKKFEERQVLVPSKKKNRFLRRLIKRQSDDSTLYQIRSMEKFKKYSLQKLVKYCQFCKLKIKTVIDNQQNIPVKRFKKIRTVASKSNKSTVKKAKKKKKKDFAGLKTSAVLSAKRARAVGNNLDESPPLKRSRLATSPAKCNQNAPGSSSNNLNSDKWDILENYQTSTNSNIGNEQLEIINLITPKSKNSNTNKIGNKQLNNPVTNISTPTKQLDSPDIINLITPTSTNSNTNEIGNEQLESPDFISLITPTKTPPNVIDLKTRAYKMAIKRSSMQYKLRLRELKKRNEKKSNDTPQSVNIQNTTPSNNNQTKTPESVNKQNTTTSNNNKTRTSPSVKKQNTTTPNNNNATPKRLSKKERKAKARANKASTKKVKKLNSLKELLRDNTSLNNTVSNLELFLNSIPKTN